MTSPDATLIERVKAELARCLPPLMSLFPDPEFQATSPKLEIQKYAPLPQQGYRRVGHRIMIAHGDLEASAEGLLTVLLHKLVHLANAFAWSYDCTYISRHNGRFRTLAEHVGLMVDWVDKRYAWAQTTPTTRLCQFFRDLAFPEDLLLPSRIRRSARSGIWHCGECVFPTREQIATILGRPVQRSCPKPKVHRMTISALGQRPALRIRGKWLLSYGFSTACPLRVEARYGELRIQGRTF
ncbi:MAG: SymE family type I addiction module toxin [Planctomycetota bacterium]|jgi:hypothetical protein